VDDVAAHGDGMTDTAVEDPAAVHNTDNHTSSNNYLPSNNVCKLQCSVFFRSLASVTCFSFIMPAELALDCNLTYLLT